MVLCGVVASSRPRAAGLRVASGLDGVGYLPASVAEMADEYVARIREVRPEGPYRLLGWSFGGHVAHAVATRLRAQGEVVEPLVINEIDHPDWLNRVRDSAAEVPARIIAAMRQFGREPGDEAVLLLRGLPVDGDALPPTPNESGSVQRAATVPAATAALLALQLGDLYAFREEKAGALVQNVVPVPGMEDTQGNAGSVELTMHVENAFHPYRPDYVGLLCLRNDHDNVAGLRVSSIRNALDLVPDALRRTLRQPRFRTEAPDSFNLAESTMEPSPVLSGHPDDPDVRVDFASTEPLDDGAREAVAVLSEAFDTVSRTLILESGDLAFVDNRLCLHGRTAFRTRYDGRDRWLQRVFVSRDLRRSRTLRPEDGPVVWGVPSREGDAQG